MSLYCRLKGNLVIFCINLLIFPDVAMIVPHVTEKKACGTEMSTDSYKQQQAFV